MNDSAASQAAPLSWGEMEWRQWLNDPGVPETPEWVPLLSREAGRLMQAGDVGGAVRLLEQAVSPASPVFDALTGPKARDLAARLKRGWMDAHPEGVAARDPWDERFREAHVVLERWVRYRKQRRTESADAETGKTAAPEVSEEANEAFFRQWVLTPLRENFLRVMDDRGLTRRQFCSSLGISEAYLSQILNGRRNPSLRKLADISRALEVDLGRLFAVRLRASGDSPWSSDAARPEPGDAGSWYPGKVSRPYAALEAHYRLVFYPGPDLPGEKIVARSFLVVDPVPGEMKFEQRYALEDEADVVVVASFAGTMAAGRKHRFMTGDGRTLEVPVVDPTRGTLRAAKGEPWLLGRIAGTLVEF